MVAWYLSTGSDRPLSSTLFDLTGECGYQNLQHHDPPVIYDMSTDPHEQVPLTPATLPNFYEIVDETKAALAAHYATVSPAPFQFGLPDDKLVPCCGGGNFPSSPCVCNDYQPGHVYP